MVPRGVSMLRDDLHVLFEPIGSTRGKNSKEEGAFRRIVRLSQYSTLTLASLSSNLAEIYLFRSGRMPSLQ